MRSRRKYIFLLIFTVVWCCILSSCQGGTQIRDYRKSGFVCKVIFDAYGVPTEATVRASRPEADGGRTLEIEMLSPEHLRGIVFCRNNKGEIYGKCGDLTLCSNAFSEILSFADLLLPEGQLKEICPSQISGRRVIYATVTGTSDHGIYLDGETCIPLEIHKGERMIKVTEFHALEDDT